MPKHERNIRYKPGSGEPYILHIWRGKRSSWKKLRSRPTDLNQAKDLADTIINRQRRRPIFIKITDPTKHQVVYMLVLAGRRIRGQRSKAR